MGHCIHPHIHPPTHTHTHTRHVHTHPAVAFSCAGPADPRAYAHLPKCEKKVRGIGQSASRCALRLAALLLILEPMIACPASQGSHRPWSIFAVVTTIFLDLGPSQWSNSYGRRTWFLSLGLSQIVSISWGVPILPLTSPRWLEQM
jgi:hypothetical protein